MSIVSGTVGAIMGSNAQKSAAKKQKDAAMAQVDEAQRQYDINRRIFYPYQQAGYYGLGQLYGQDVTYEDPYLTLMTGDEVKRKKLDKNKLWYKDDKGNYFAGNTKTVKGDGTPFDLLADPWTGKKMQAPEYDDVVTNELGNYEDDPGTAAMRSLGKAALNKQAQKFGISYSPGTMSSRLAELNQKYDQTGYSDYKAQLTDRYKALQAEFAQKRDINQNQYNTLLDAVKIGQNASGSAGQASNNYTSAYQNAMNQLGNAQAQSGAAEAALWSGLGNVSGSAFSNGLKLADYGQKAGWWGSGSAAAGLGEAAAADAAVASAATSDLGTYATLFGL
jgi:hypothetical protein